MKQKLIVPVLAVVAAGTIAVGAATVSAQTIDESGYPSIVAKIAERFNLNEAEVKAVFDEERETHHLEMQQKMEERLSAAVEAGELTEEQKQAILTKVEAMHAEREANFDAMRTMSEEERRATMEARRDEMELWAEENGIDGKYLMIFGKRGHGPGGHGMMFMERTATESTEAAS